MENFKDIFYHKLHEAKKLKISIPSDMESKFAELVDKFMDVHNMSGDAAREKAMSELGLNKPKKKEIKEGFKRAKRTAKFGTDVLKKEIARLAYRKGMKEFNVTDFVARAKELNLPTGFGNEEIQDERGRAKSLGSNIQKLISSAYSSSKDDKLKDYKGRKKAELRDYAKKIETTTSDKASAEKIYQDQPMTDKKAKDLFLKIIYRKKDLGLL
jgi:hypothetical protein